MAALGRDQGACVAKNVPAIDGHQRELLFQFFGRYIGICFFHQLLIPFPLSLPLIKLIQGDKVKLADIRAGDRADFDRFVFFISNELSPDDWEEYYEEWAYLVNEKAKRQTYVQVSDFHGIIPDLFITTNL